MVPARARRRPGSYGRSLFGASFGRVSKEKKSLAVELVEDLGEDRCPRERGPLFRAVLGATVLGMIVALAVMQGGTVTWAKLLSVLAGGLVTVLVGAGAGLLASGDEGDPGS